jgi:hypothetical protein
MKQESEAAVAPGLGLTIVARVMALHGGHAQAENASDGGLIIELHFPQAARITSELVRLGIHPFDEFGRKRFNGQHWWHAFSETAGEVTFSNALTSVTRGDLSQDIMKSQYGASVPVPFGG